MFVGTTDIAVNVKCPFPTCAAPPGKWCMNRDGRPSTRLHPSRRELVAIDWSAAEQAHTGVTEAERAYRDACAERDAAFLRLHQSGLPYRVIASHFRIGHDRVVIAANRAKDKAAA